MEIDFTKVPGVIEVISKEQTTLVCEPETFEATCFFVKSNINGVWLIDIFATDKTILQKNIELNYLFHIVEIDMIFILSKQVTKDQSLKSISHLFKNASVYEQEINEFFGLEFDRSYTHKYFHRDNKIYPMLKDELRRPKPKEAYESDVFIKNIFKKNHLKFILGYENNKISRCQVNHGYFHRGVEKILENQTLAEAYVTCESLFSNHVIDWSFLYSSAIEKTLHIEIPERAKALRMVMLEFSRVYNHILFIRDLTILLESDRLYYQSLLWIKRIQSLFISYSGNEYLRSVIRTGGVTKDVNQSWLSRAMDEIYILEKEILGHYKYTLASETWKNILNISLVQKSESADSSLTGPLVRSTGLNIDYRKVSPFYFYNEVDYEIPVATSGTAFDLYCIKVEEIFQSLKIIIQVIDNLPTGSCMNNQFLDLSKIENSNKFFSENEIRNKVDKYLEVEADISNLSYIESSNGLMMLNLNLLDNKIYRARMYSNDLNLVSVFERVSKQKDISDIELLWTILAPNMKNVER